MAVVEAGELTLGQAAKCLHIPTEVLRQLCRDAKVPARKSDRGQYYLRANELPDPMDVWQYLAGIYQQRLRHARAALDALQSELTALEEDLQRSETAAQTLQPGRPPRLGAHLRECPYRNSVLSHVADEFRHAALALGAAHHDLDWAP